MSYIVLIFILCCIISVCSHTLTHTSPLYVSNLLLWVDVGWSWIQVSGRFTQTTTSQLLVTGKQRLHSIALNNTVILLSFWLKVLETFSCVLLIGFKRGGGIWILQGSAGEHFNLRTMKIQLGIWDAQNMTWQKRCIIPSRKSIVLTLNYLFPL